MTVQSPPFDHAARVLGLHDVFALVASACVNAGARAAVTGLRATNDADAIRTSLGEIDEYRRMREDAGDIAIPDTSYRGAVAEIAGGARGSGEALRRIGEGERAIAQLRRAVAAAGESFPALAAIAAGATPNETLVAEIDRALDAEGEVRDDATPALKAIRRDIRAARNSLRERAERMLGEIGTEAHATVMGTRHVLVVPRGRVKRGSGLVHGASQTGGSLYFEPMALLDLNNELETRLADEHEEIDRILRALSDRVRQAAPAITANADVVERLDALRAKAAFAARFGCITPDISGGDTPRLHLVRARHPLLTLALNRAGSLASQVPLDLTLEGGQRLMVITGPNAGGKTVALKTVGLLVLMLQCGLPVPCAHGSELPLFERVLVDIGDEQSLESSLSTFTSHLSHLTRMTRLANPRVLCLVDEIGDGTDPDEGAAIAIATLERLLASRAAVIATTHYGRIKTFALETAGVANASMAFAEETAQPLFRLLQGIAGRSRGIDTARRTGFDAELVGRAEAILGGDAFRLESALARLEKSYAAMEREREALETERRELEKLTASAQEKEQAFSLTRKEASRKAAREAEEMLAQTRREIEDIVRQLRERAADKATIRESRQRVERLMGDVRARARDSEPAADALASVAVGDRVSLSPGGKPAGVVVEVVRKSAVVDIGGKRIRARIGKIYRAAADPVHKAPPPPAVGVDYEPVGETEVHVRGMLREDALEIVSRFIDRAVLSGLREVKVVHGRGEGILSRAVREELRRDPRVASFRFGDPMEGGNGVTFVTLR
ncbi:MAG: Smr/MutS family protein [Candidatus Krumholzibacteria bacterium]|nr:Smr/MutS family protein [Candidatus Krumholzibacteria bacterium]MDH5270245.1 Smr/MutS family protein [Candidatus Krumholzibacteria bacterium]